ncbi:MAG TPA: hypothetical protein VLF18_08180 [Tahibacter sp.]|uniref:hypothetical protein n=1 Tax=Tahibacter sp. TaxID=2056211 RepID=UPI002CC00452|nr:hypothetical protein [Tahibacter sp.]HSX60160.1 hypothetical protein [Tahibacter sp.]
MRARFVPSIVKHRRAVGVAAGVALALTAVSYDSRRVDAPSTPAPAAGAAPAAAARAAAPEFAPTVDAALLVTPEAQAHFAREHFQSRARAFFAQAAALDAAAREHEARALAADIDVYEQRRMLSAGEAMTLRIGLVDATAATPAERADGVAAIVARYESDGQQREARWLAQQASDSAFQRYKTRESAIVAEVMAMAQIPDGLSRDDYLRRRLEAERVAAMQ